MMTKKKRLICLSSMGGVKVVARMFNSVVPYVPRMKMTPDDVLLFEGGTDVNPDLYGESRGRATSYPDIKRDAIENNAFVEACLDGAACIGICRGAQFLTVMNGGSLIQDVTNHCQDHKIRTKDGRTILVTSTHHQMMAPPPPETADIELIAWSDYARSHHYWDGDNKDCRGKLEVCENLEPEIVWYPESRSLCIQGHPEYMKQDQEFPEYCRELIKTYIFEENQE